MIALLLGLGLGHTLPGVLAAGPSDAIVRAVSDGDDPHERRSQDDTRPRGNTLEMGPAATSLSILALVAALFVRARRRGRA